MNCNHLSRPRSAIAWWFTLLTVVLLLGGCAHPIESSRLGAGQGVVTLRIVSLHERTLRKLTLVNEQTQQEVSLAPLPSLGGDSYRFTGVVAAGTYRTKQVEGSDIVNEAWGTMSYSLTAPLSAPENLFNVAASQLTNLGTMVIVPLPGTGSRFIALREGTPVAAREWLTAVNPELAASLDMTRELSWSMPINDPKSTDKLLYAEERAVPSTKPVLDANGSLWQGGKLGLVAELTSWGAKRKHHTGTVQQILAVTPLADGRLLAAGEEGYVAVSNEERRGWREVPAPVSKASTAMLVAQQSAGEVVLVTRTPRGVAVYSANPKDFAWKELRRIERDSASGTAGGAVVAFASLGQARPFAVMTRERLVVYTPDPELLSSFNFRDRNWEQHKPTTSAVDMAASADGLVYVRNAVPSTWATNDFGKNWWKIESDGLQLPPVFSNGLTGYKISKPLMTWKAEPPAFRKTTDGGKNWTATGTMPPNFSWAGRLMHDDKRRRLGYMQPSGAMVWTEDEGKTWK